MRRNIQSVIAALAAGAVLAALGAAVASPSRASAGPAGTARAPGGWLPATTGLPAAAGATGAAGGRQLWVRRYHGPGTGNDRASAVAVSPADGTVFITGRSFRARSNTDFATIAYQPATGAQRWLRRYDGPVSASDSATAIVVSRGGGRVFVTGQSQLKRDSLVFAYTTVAYRASTGAQLWARQQHWQAGSLDDAEAVAVSPDGRTVYVTGTSSGPSSTGDYATVAYRAGTGARLWARRYNGPANGDDRAASVTVSPGGGEVFVTGRSQAPDSSSDYATVAYRAGTGARLWVKRYHGPGSGADSGGAARKVAVSPVTGTVFVTGFSEDASSNADYATVAYNPATGAQLWVQRYSGPAGSSAGAVSLAVSPGGQAVFVTGTIGGVPSANDAATVAYDAATGAQLWAQVYHGLDNLFDASSVAISPRGDMVAVTGISVRDASADDYTTVAYDPATGAQLWAQRYNGRANGSDDPSSVAIGPDGTVVVTGSSNGTSTATRLLTDYATVAYRGG